VHKKPRNGKAQAKTGDKIIEIPEQARHIEDQDQEFFQGDDVGDFSFLEHLDAIELGKRVHKEKVIREDKPSKVKSDVFKSNDNPIDEDDSEVLSDALDDNEVDQPIWEEEQIYELKPRTGDSSWRKKESTKLPVRGVNGRLVQIDDGASGSKSGSFDEEEESDSDSDGDDDSTGAVESSLKEQPVVTGPEAVIEAKEALARLAEEIVESPEEKVQFSVTQLTLGIKFKVISRIVQQGQSRNQKACSSNSTHSLQRHHPWVL